MELVSSKVDAKGYVNEHYMINTCEFSDIKSRLISNEDLALRVSLVLVTRLLRQSDSSSLPRNVVSQIEYLDRGTETTMKKAEQFKGDVLGRFWHQHFWCENSLLVNMFKETGLLDESNGQKFLSLFHRLANRKLRGGLESLPGHLTIGALKSRSDRQGLTGEWIIFAKHKGKNYYIDIAMHKEAEDQEKLLSKLKNSSQAEFPFLWT
jgi:hypothetical protein